MLRSKRLWVALAIVLALLVSSCRAQEAAYVRVVNPTSNVTVSSNVSITGVVTVANTPLPVSVTNPLPISGNVTATANITGQTVNIQQNVVADANNSSTANLAVGANFTGTSTSTLSIVGIQVSLKTDQLCTVYVQQSPDGTNWDIADHFDYRLYNGGSSWTVQAVNSYYRVIVVNVGNATTTYFRLQTALCPVVEAVPRAPNDKGRLITDATLSDTYGFESEMTPMGEIRTADIVKLVGANFIGQTLDSNFWSTNTAAQGSVSQSGGQVTLSTNTTADGSATLVSFRRGRYVAGSSMRFRAVVQNDAGTANNKRRWGIADYTTLATATDGAYFSLNGTALQVATLKGGTETAIVSGDFNGSYGRTYVLDTNAHTFEIYWTNSSVWFSIDGELLHKASFATTTWANTMTQYLWMDNVNSGGSTTNLRMFVRVASIARMGAFQNAPIYKHIATATTTICKYGAGSLHQIVVNDPQGVTITVYDNYTAGGSVVAVIKPLANSSPVTLTYKMDFYTGLTVVTSGTVDITVVYE